MKVKEKFEKESVFDEAKVKKKKKKKKLTTSILVRPLRHATVR